MRKMVLGFVPYKRGVLALKPISPFKFNEFQTRRDGCEGWGGMGGGDGEGGRILASNGTGVGGLRKMERV